VLRSPRACSPTRATGLSLRRVAAESGGSTQIVYTLFGGKPGLADALYAEGFRRLGASMRRRWTPHRRPATRSGCSRSGAATGRSRGRAAFFSVMFGRAIPGFTPARATRAAGRSRTLGRVVQAAQEAIDAGRSSAPTRMCWPARARITTHGISSLRGERDARGRGRRRLRRGVLRAPGAHAAG
jgi:AcrR family transcriptional regulator